MSKVLFRLFRGVFYLLRLCTPTFLSNTSFSRTVRLNKLPDRLIIRQVRNRLALRKRMHLHDGGGGGEGVGLWDRAR
jgi:hypothetical protein